MSDIEGYMNVKEVVGLLDVSPYTYRGWAKRLAILTFPHPTDERQKLIRTEDVKELLKYQREKNYGRG